MPNTSKRSKVILRNLSMTRKKNLKIDTFFSPFMLMKKVSKSQKCFKVPIIKLISHPSLNTETQYMRLSLELMDYKKVADQFFSSTLEVLIEITEALIIKQLLNSQQLMETSQSKFSLDLILHSERKLVSEKYITL